MNSNPAPHEHQASASDQDSPLQIRGPKKHRRPALSCIQCRRRKVKCDRNVPCNRCTHSKGTICVYDPEAPARVRASLHGMKSTPAHKTSENPKISTEQMVQNVTPLQTPISSMPDARSPVVSWARSSIPHEFESTELTVEELKERIRQLEKSRSVSLDNQERTEDIATGDTISKGPILRGTPDQSRFFGMGHWLTIKKEFGGIHSLRGGDKFGGSSEVPKLLKKCKEVARSIKSQKPTGLWPLPDFNSQVPPRETSDRLVEYYFRTFETSYRILHRPSFDLEYERYWNDPLAAKSAFIIKLLLVLAIGSTFYQDDPDGRVVPALAAGWISAAQAWLSSSHDKSRLNLPGIEIQCLLFIARQMYACDTDTLWIMIGSLIRLAMSVGLHRDPSNFPKMTVFYSERRRRLWATVIEMAIQSSLDSGMPPMFSLDDFDCEPPGNYNDIDIGENAASYPPKNPDTVFTESSIQITLLESLPTRMEITKVLNGFRSEPGYEQALDLSSTLTSHIRSHVKLYQASQSSTIPFTTCDKNVLDLFHRRYLLALNIPFAVQAKTDPRFYFSRKVALEAALTVLAYPASADPVDEFAIIRSRAGGCFRETLARASAFIALELITQINEESSSPFLTTPSPAKIARRPLHDAIELAVILARSRLDYGETNVKGYMFFSMLRAQTLAMESGGNAMEAIKSGGKKALEEAYESLRKQTVNTPPETIDTMTPASSTTENFNGMTGMDDFNWDLLETEVDFDVENTWLFGNLDNGAATF